MKTTKKVAMPCMIREIWRDAEALMVSLHTAVRDGREFPEGFDQLLAVIGALPLTTEDFALATCRLSNAARYYAQGEAGAATYELTLAEKSLAKYV